MAQRNLKNDVSRIKTRQLLSPTRVKEVYYKKGTFYGDNLQETIYPTVKVSHSNKERTDYIKKMDSEKRVYSLHRARQMIYWIVHANAYKHGDFRPIFCTLTYQKEQQLLSAANREFRYFITKLNIELSSKLKYICVPEIQKKRELDTGKGVWHFHVVFFNLPFIPIKTFESLWGHGYVDLQVSRDIKDVGAYLAKYLTKDTYDDRLYGQRTYNCSQDIFRPIHTFDDLEIDSFIKDDTVKCISTHEGTNKIIKTWKKQHK